MRSNSKLLIFAAACAVFVEPAAAATLDFNGTASSTCALTNAANGTIEVQPDLRTWATTVPATITVSNTAANYVLTVTHDTNWGSAPLLTPTTTFSHVATITAGPNTSAQFTTTGASSGATLASVGDNDVSVNLNASAATPFLAGVHRAQVTVTCAAP